MLPVWVKPVAIIALVAAISASAYGLGVSHTEIRYNSILSERDRVAAVQLARAERVEREKESAAADALYQQAAKRLEVESRAKSETDSLRADLRTARVRLSIPVASCAVPEAGADPALAAGSGAEGRAELLPEAAERIIAIAIDSDRAMRERNAVIAAYNAVREQYNGAMVGNPDQ